MFAAHFIICADGGANRLYDAFPDKLLSFLPAVVAGDLDSIRPDVQQHFQKAGSEIVDQSHDQDTTDLQKCLSQIEARFTKQRLASSTIVAAGQLLLLYVIYGHMVRGHIVLHESHFSPQQQYSKPFQCSFQHYST